MKNLLIPVFFFFGITLAMANEITVKGQLVCKKSGIPVPFANIGIHEKAIGTVSLENGFFELTIDTQKTSKSDVVVLSSLGYKPVKFSVASFIDYFTKNNSMVLEEEAINLDEVVLKAENYPEGSLGFLSNSTNHIGYWKNDIALGGEIATLFQLKKNKTRLNKLNFNILENRSDSLLVRLNLYKMQGGKPGATLHTNQIRFSINKASGPVSIDLSDYNLVVEGDFIAGLELLKVYGDTVGLALSSERSRGFKSYIKMASQDKWKVIYDTQMAFQFEVSYLEKDLKGKEQMVSKKKRPGKITVLWDNSLSMANKNLDKELDFLQKYVEYLEKAEVEVISFSNKNFNKKSFQVTGKNWEPLQTYLRSFVYDGATYLPNGLHMLDSDEVLMFSDGFFSNTKDIIKVNKPVYAILSTQEKNVETINALAGSSKGNIIDLTQLSVDEGLELQKNHYPVKLLTPDDNKAQPFTVKGRISNHETPVKMVTVTNLNSKTSVKTNTQGEFEIFARPADTLKFEQAGYETIEALVSKNTKFLDLNLNEVNYNLDEIVVNERALKKDINDRNRTNSDRVINSKDFNPGAIFLTDALANKISGLIVQGFGSEARIFSSRPALGGRGGKQDLLFILDGVPLSNTDINQVIDPQNIDHVIFKRSLASGNIYGNLGRAGVLEIYTKGFVQDRNKTEAANGENNPNVYQGNFIHVNNLTSPKPLYIQPLESSNNFDKAYSRYLSERQLYGNSYQYYLDVFKYFYDKGDKTRAFTIASNIVEEFSADFEAMNSLALVLESLGEFNEANAVNQKIALQTDSFNAHFRIFEYYKRSGNYQKALETLESYLTTNPLSNVEFIDFLRNEITNIYRKMGTKTANKVLDPFYLDEAYDARITVTWNNPDAQFELQFVGPNQKYSTWAHTYKDNIERLNFEKVSGCTTQDFYLQNSDPGKWLLNIKNYEGSLLNPLYLKVNVTLNFGTPNQTETSKLIKLTSGNLNVTLEEIMLNNVIKRPTKVSYAREGK